VFVVLLWRQLTHIAHGDEQETAAARTTAGVVDRA
jgi:hypothetical protein